MISTLRGIWEVKLTSYSADTLRTALAAWRRWSAWILKQAPPIPPLPALEVHVALFARQVFLGADVHRRNAGGSGAVASVLAGLRFLHDHLGLDIRTRDSLVSSVTLDEEAKPLKQAEPLQLRDLAVLEALMESPNDVLSFLCCAALALTYGGVRFRHLQRSKPSHSVKEGVVFTCHQGKTRKNGRPAAPFQWFLPQHGVWRRDLADTFCEKWRQLTSQSVGFLVPSLWPYRTTLQKAKGFVLLRMNVSSWNRVIRQLVSVEVATWPRRTGEEPSSYSPSLGDS